MFGPRLANKVAFITGAGMGQGRAASRLFAAHGAKVVVADVDAAAAQSTVELVTEAGGVAFAVVVGQGLRLAAIVPVLTFTTDALIRAMVSGGRWAERVAIQPQIRREPRSLRIRRRIPHFISDLIVRD